MRIICSEKGRIIELSETYQERLKNAKELRQKQFKEFYTELEAKGINTSASKCSLVKEFIADLGVKK